MEKEPHPNSTDGHHHGCQMAHWVWQRRQVIKQTKAEMTFIVLNTARECDRGGDRGENWQLREAIAVYLAACPWAICLPQLLDVSDLASRDHMLAQMMHLVSDGLEGKSLGYVSYCIWEIDGTVREYLLHWYRSFFPLESQFHRYKWISFKIYKQLKHWRSYGRCRCQFLT